MTDILTITLNPAIDKSTSIAALIPEKKIRCSVPKFEPGGGGINMARAIKKLGGHAKALFMAGGYTGFYLTDLLNAKGIESEICPIANPTRENLVVADLGTGQQYRFVMPGPSIAGVEWEDLLTRIEHSGSPRFIVASGSIPENIPTDIFARIGAIAKKKKAKYVVDTSGEALQYAVKEGVYLLKPNLGELSSLAGKATIQLEQVYETAQSVILQGGCEVMVVSMGAAGAMLVTKNSQKQLAPPLVKIKSTVGAGDSMLAGILLCLEKNLSLEHSLRYGIACGTAATMNPGTGLCKKEDADRLYNLLQDK
ncbi:MAG: hexose kinase [Terrimonas sp.]|nr:hexose kinase [Terrimonas sp.]